MSEKNHQSQRRMTAVELADEVRRAAKGRAAWQGMTLRDYITSLIVEDVKRSQMGQVG
jgi:predicted DNA binding CopG/RHH family protein